MLHLLSGSRAAPLPFLLTVPCTRPPTAPVQRPGCATVQPTARLSSLTLDNSALRLRTLTPLLPACAQPAARTTRAGTFLIPHIQLAYRSIQPATVGVPSHLAAATATPILPAWQLLLPAVFDNAPTVAEPSSHRRVRRCTPLFPPVAHSLPSGSASDRTLRSHCWSPSLRLPIHAVAAPRPDQCSWRTSPGTVACDSNSAPAAALPPLSRTARPDARTHRSLPLSHGPTTP